VSGHPADTTGAGQDPFIEPGSPWENGYIECFKEEQRGELLGGRQPAQ